jgi:RHS repeat-associated protein
MFDTTKYTQSTTLSMVTGHSCNNEKGYSYRFNGKENDKEGLGGGGSTYDYGFRIYNSQLGKFLSVDPLTKSYAFYTPYQFAGNKPIVALDLDGREDVWYQYIKQNDGSYLLVSTEFDVSEQTRILLKAGSGKQIPKEGVLSTLSNSDGTISVLSYTPVVTVVEDKTMGNMMNEWSNSMYGSEQAQDNFIDIVDNGGKIVKGGGLCVACFAPPAGAAIYGIGEAVTVGADLMKTAKHMEKGETGEAIVEATGFIANKIGGSASDKFLEEGRKKLFAESLFDIIIDQVKDQAKEQIQKSEKTQTKPKKD